MQTTKIVYWEEDSIWLGYLPEFPDCWTQGDTLDDLRDHLRNIYAELTGDTLTGIRRVDLGCRGTAAGTSPGAVAPCRTISREGLTLDT